jgi:hypothetical protein
MSCRFLLAGFQLSLIGRFWVSPEGCDNGLHILNNKRLYQSGFIEVVTVDRSDTSPVFKRSAARTRVMGGQRAPKRKLVEHGSITSALRDRRPAALFVD